jgi:hypothetical protein
MALAADSPAVLGHLETQGRVVTIWAGPQPSYTVRAKDGKVLAERLTLKQLNAKFPELRRAVDGSYATWAGM